MPRRDGTGPLGSGAMTGRGLGFCTGTDAVRYNVGLRKGIGKEFGLGLGLGYGRKRGCRQFFGEKVVELADKELLTEQKELLQQRLNVIDKQLESLSESDK